MVGIKECGGGGGFLLPPLPASADETYTSVIITSVYAGCKQNPLMYFRALPSTVGTIETAKRISVDITKHHGVRIGVCIDFTPCCSSHLLIAAGSNRTE